MPRKNKEGSAGHNTATSIESTSGKTQIFRKAQIETLGAVASVLGHESRNLLGALGTCVQILGKNPHLTREDGELLDIIQSGSHRLHEIVSEFSAFANPRPPRSAPVDLHHLIDETLILLERDDRCASSIALTRTFDPKMDTVKADREQLGQVLWHLCLNAVQAMGDRGQLWVETHRESTGAKLVVRDTGPGIAAAVRARIFEPLYTTKSRGAGLGLAIVQRIVAAHGGKVTVQSDPGAGTSVMVWLPIGPKDHRRET